MEEALNYAKDKITHRTHFNYIGNVNFCHTHACVVPRESIPDNTPQATIDIAEGYIEDTLLKVLNGLGYAYAKAETNKILFDAFLNNRAGGYSYGLLTIIANNAMFEY